jgi:hypothetical protein
MFGAATIRTMDKAHQQKPGLSPPLAARVERKPNMDCLYSPVCVYGVTIDQAIWLILF